MDEGGGLGLGAWGLGLGAWGRQLGRHPWVPKIKFGQILSLFQKKDRGGGELIAKHQLHVAPLGNSTIELNLCDHHHHNHRHHHHYFHH